MPPESSQLILASSSPHRATLLQRLGIPFLTEAPGIDESPLDDETPQGLVLRLAIGKAVAVCERHPGAIVLGSDQIAVHGETVIGKPGNAERAARQLEAFSGRTVQFLTSVALLRGTDEAGAYETIGQAVVETRVEFRELDENEIERYLRIDEPFDCAGSFRAESLGPALFESAFSQDPTAIIGLPLIETARLLRMAGFKVP